MDYDRHGRTYARHRQADRRIEARVHAALGDAATVLNVGAGTGSYEPRDRWLLAVEPSATMRANRPAGAAPALAASAEALPFDDESFDAAMACMTVHHWHPRAVGLAEMRRVTRGPVVVLTFELGGRTRIETIPTPADCTDGFFEAYWNRPEALLDPEVRASQSLWELLDEGVEERIVARLAASLQSGEWDAEHGHLRAQKSFDGSLRLVVSEP